MYFIIVLLTLLANFVAKRLLSRLHSQLEKTSTLWDDALITAARKPLAALIWVIGIAWAAEVASVAFGCRYFWCY